MLWLTLFLILLFLLFQKLIMGSFSSSIWLDLAIFSNSGKELIIFYMIVVVQLLSHVRLFATSWIVQCYALLSSTISWSLPKFMSIELVMLSNHLIFCHPFFFCFQFFPASESFPESQLSVSGSQSTGASSFSIRPSSEYSGLISFRIDWFDFLEVQGTLKGLLQHCSSKASIFQLSVCFMV